MTESFSGFISVGWHPWTLGVSIENSDVILTVFPLKLLGLFSLMILIFFIYSVSAEIFFLLLE